MCSLFATVWSGEELDDQKLFVEFDEVCQHV